MIQTKGYAVSGPDAAFEVYNFERRDVGASDILMDVLFCGICHSDIHQARGEWGNSTFPMVPGHEIVGRVSKVGGDVTKFAIGDIAGIGCFVDSCRTCSNCTADCEQFCKVHCSATYNGTEMDKMTMTFGGYSKHYVVDEAYALKNTEIVKELNLPPVKIHCSVLAEDAIKAAVADYKTKKAS